MDITLYGRANCDTVKKARAWLAGHGIAYRFHDFRKDGVTPALLAAWVDAAPWEALVNRRGTTWRGLSGSQRDAVVDAGSAVALMAESPSVIKRPVLTACGLVYIGFSADTYAQIFSGAAGARQNS